MRQANTTFVNLRAALDDVDPLIADLGAPPPTFPSSSATCDPLRKTPARSWAT